MAILFSNLFKKLKGKIGDFVFYDTHGQTRLRSNNRKRAVDPTPTQQLQQCRMRSAVAFYRSNRHTPVPGIWKQGASDKIMSGYNLFLSVNISAFNDQHRIADYSLLHLSCGKLELPAHLQITNYDKGYVSLQWQNVFPPCSQRAEDRLQVAWLHARGSFNLQTLDLSDFLRKDGEACFRIAEAGNPSLHLYVYFADQIGQCFSPDKYFFLEGKK